MKRVQAIVTIVIATAMLAGCAVYVPDYPAPGYTYAAPGYVYVGPGYYYGPRYGYGYYGYHHWH